MTGLYVHIPFCERKCSYCAFYSFSKPWKNERRFFQGLEKEIKNLNTDFCPTTIFIGGGTPTAPSFQTLEEFLPNLGKFSPAEFSVEVNPGTVDAEKFSLLRKSGVNRISIGVQSFDFQCLETLGRVHSAEKAEAAFRLARAAGFENISLDLMFGIPGQTMEKLNADLDQALALGPEHVAIYNLMYEEGTLLAQRTKLNVEPCQSPSGVGQAESLQGDTRSRIREARPTINKQPFVRDRMLVRLDEELEREMYDLIRKRLTGAGFEHYEISNFAKPGFECQHNLLYWTGGEYIGCGPSAHSHWNGTRWANVARVNDWSEREFEETLDPEAKERETLVMGLRLLKGVKVSSKVWKQLRCIFQRLDEQGLIKIDGHHVRLSEEALFVSDAVFAELV